MTSPVPGPSDEFDRPSRQADPSASNAVPLAVNLAASANGDSSVPQLLRDSAFEREQLKAALSFGRFLLATRDQEVTFGRASDGNTVVLPADLSISGKALIAQQRPETGLFQITSTARNCFLVSRPPFLEAILRPFMAFRQSTIQNDGEVREYVPGSTVRIGAFPESVLRLPNDREREKMLAFERIVQTNLRLMQRGESFSAFENGQVINLGQSGDTRGQLVFTKDQLGRTTLRGNSSARDLSVWISETGNSADLRKLSRGDQILLKPGLLIGVGEYWVKVAACFKVAEYAAQFSAEDRALKLSNISAQQLIPDLPIATQLTEMYGRIDVTLLDVYADYAAELRHTYALGAALSSLGWKEGYLASNSTSGPQIALSGFWGVAEAVRMKDAVIGYLSYHNIRCPESNYGYLQAPVAQQEAIKNVGISTKLMAHDMFLAGSKRDDACGYREPGIVYLRYRLPTAVPATLMGIRSERVHIDPKDLEVFDTNTSCWQALNLRER